MPLLFERESGPTLIFTASNLNSPRSVKLSDGRILVVVQDPTMGGILYGRFFDANGNDTGLGFQIGNHLRAVTGLAALSNGGFAVVFVGPDGLHDVFLERYDSAGVPIGSAVQVNNSGGISQAEAVVAVLAGGRMVVAWTNRDPSSPDADHAIAARILEADGTPATGQFLVNQPPYAGAQQDAKILALANGNFVIGWEGSVQPGGLQIFDSQGNRIGAEIVKQIDSMVLLSNGNFVATGATGAFIYDQTGALVASIPDPAGFERLLVLGAFNGGFVVRVANADGPDTLIFDNMGVQQGPRFELSEADNFDQVQILANGGFLFSGLIMDGHFRAVETQVIRLDDGMVDIALSQGSISEGTVLNSYVASASYSMGALNGVYTLSIVSDSLGGAFRLDGDRLILDRAGVLDYETATTVQITIAANDGYGNVFNETIQLNVIDEPAEQAITGSDARLTFGRELAPLPGGRLISFLTSPETGSNSLALGQLFDSGMNLLATFTVENDPAYVAHRNFDVAGQSSGGFVVTWSAFNNNVGLTVQARVFDAAGGPVSGVLQVNTPSGFGALEPEVVALGSGRFLIAWEDQSTDDIRAQVFSAAGAKIGTEYALNSTLPGQQDQIALQPLASGGFLATWTSVDGASTEVRARLFDSLGAPLGADFVVNTTTVDDQLISTINALASGNILVTWASRDSNSVTDDAIRGQLFDSAGARIGGEFLLQILEQYELNGRHRVIALPSGGFALAWTEVGVGPDTDGASVWAQLFNANGSAASAAFLVNTDVAGDQVLTDLVLLGNGELYVAWAEPTPFGGTPTNALARTFDLTGTRTDWSTNDVLYGSPGADTLSGGGGNDTYIVNHPGDRVIEAAGEGANDAVYASVSYTLETGQEIETLSTLDWNSTAPLNLTGNEIANYMTGNAGANVLNGGGGADVMQGLGGNDTYIIDHAGDQIYESIAGTGNDAAYSSVSYTLAAGEQIETLATLDWNSTAAINLTGNEIANYIIGNAGANILNGGTGADVLQGLGGNDTYIIDHAGDQIYESIAGTGNDAAYSSVSYTLAAGEQIETLATLDWGSTVAINLTGNEIANYIIGNAGANVLNGGAGFDALQGLGGADTFAFTTALGSGNVDQIVDFLSGTDKIALDDAIFGGIGTPGNFTAGAFVVGSAALDANDRIVYNQATGQLFYDADGNGAGAAVLFAVLNGAPVLTASDFQVI